MRYGRRSVYYEPGGPPRRAAGSAPQLGTVERAAWRAARAEQAARQQEQLTQYRFRHQRAACLVQLAARWAAASASTEPLP